MRKIIALLSLVTLASIFLFSDEIASFFESVQIYAEGGRKEMFEIALTGEQIMSLRRSELLKDGAYHKSTLQFIPHILLETKYLDEKERSKEGWLLWSQSDGEIVLDTETWGRTHGFRDALLSDATQGDFLLIYALARRNGHATKEQIRKDLKLEKDAFERAISDAAQKKLVVQLNSTLKLHMEDPQLPILPFSRIRHSVVTRDIDFASLAPKNFTAGKIQKTAKATFGKDFTIRSVKEVFLPVWKIEVKRPDGSLSTSTWNAVNGMRYN